MASFKRKTISQGQTVADKLRRARLEKNLTLEDLAKKTKIQIKYLEALENGDYASLPGDVYVRTWLKLYSQELDISPHELLSDFKIEKQVGNKNQVIKNKSKFDWHKFLKPKFLKWAVIGLVFLIFIGYLAWEINNIIAPPEVLISEPVNNYRTTESSITIIGQTQAEVQVKINNEIILLDDQGNFSQTINLAIGLNNLEISAKKKHSKTNNLELVILRENTE